MRIIVAIANYGTKNVEYAKQLIQEYQSMPFDVDIFILSEMPKDYGKDVTVLVGLPSKNPWSLPFAHKTLFSENIDKYDVFIYTEDDTLILKENILAFLKASDILGRNILPGFIRYELYPNGKKSYPDIHGPYHWIPKSVCKIGEYVFARLSNEHSACYLLTQEHLRSAIASGGFLVPPHSGRYDLICSAGTDPYTQCGLTKVICISHLSEFDIHHLPDAYLNGTGLIENNCAGLDEVGLKLQIEALFDVLSEKKTDKTLFVTEKPLFTLTWDKNYYEPCQYELLKSIPSKAMDILSIGCGWGATEAYLLEQGKRVKVMPLDAVICGLVEEKGINVLPPDFELGFEMLNGNTFDAIILSNVLQHISNPVEVLTKIGALLNMEGVIVGSIPNLSLIRRVLGRLLSKSNKWVELNGEFNNISLNFTNSSALKMWLRASNLHLLEVRYETYPISQKLARLASYCPRKIVSSNIVFTAQRHTQSLKNRDSTC
jgi:2-polyprenyl-3-methyl-5-hydroxy-6-metoxy-1,4-benzoquinol methylase